MSFSLTHSPRRSSARSTRSPRSPLLAARVLLQRSSLRRALAAGADPESSAQLARRAEQLTSLRRRRALAAALNRALREAEAPPAPFTAAVPVRRREIRKTRDEIEQLARDLLAPARSGRVASFWFKTCSRMESRRSLRRVPTARCNAPSARRARPCTSNDGPPYVARGTGNSRPPPDDNGRRARHSVVALMDVISILIALVSFALFFAMLEGLDRV